MSITTEILPYFLETNIINLSQNGLKILVNDSYLILNPL
jgi:hypothetical protein